jgi:hypothetical protein
MKTRNHLLTDPDTGKQLNFIIEEGDNYISLVLKDKEGNTQADLSVDCNENQINAVYFKQKDIKRSHGIADGCPSVVIVLVEDASTVIQ